MSSQRTVRGFTLVELLVVIAIIGVLVALLLPAIQAAREAARRSSCQNHLKQLSLGMILYHDTYNSYPSGGWGYFWGGDPDRGGGKEQPGAWPYQILPFIEQQNLRAMGSDGQPDVDTPQQLTGVTEAAQHTVETMYCPSRRPAGIYPVRDNYGSQIKNMATTETSNKTDYAANAGDLFLPFGAGPPDLSTSDIYFKNKPDIQATMRESTGIVFLRSEVNLRRVEDGTSNTYLIGEKYLDLKDIESGQPLNDDHSMFIGDDLDFHSWSRRANFSNPSQGEFLPPTPDNAQLEVQYNGGSYGDTYTWPAGYGSSHPGVWQVTFCDGSVRAMNYNIAPETHHNLSNRSDGQAVQID